jgi:hypothetical protein
MRVDTPCPPEKIVRIQENCDGKSSKGQIR